MSDAAKNIDILATSLTILHNYFDWIISTKLFFWSVSSQNFRPFSKTFHVRFKIFLSL